CFATASQVVNKPPHTRLDGTSALTVLPEHWLAKRCPQWRAITRSNTVGRNCTRGTQSSLGSVRREGLRHPPKCRARHDARVLPEVVRWKQ
ncbi:MAG: hypothetical protein JWN30_1924, partial [Bacilli bacterium]|nr:hypothetical protein [Bacilli bacterium]